MADKATGTVAVVDDDPAVLDSLKFLLEVMGCSVAIFTSAREYLADCEVRPVCMILDQHMPQMTGLELTQKLRANGVSIPVLLITGSPSPAIVARANELGIPLSFVAVHGDVTHALTDVARELHASLVVVGRSAKAFHRLVGSLSHRLTSRNDAPVVVVVP